MTGEPFLPIRIVDVDIDLPLPAIAAHKHDTGDEYGGVFCLVRRQGRPIAVVEFPFHGEDISPARLAEIILPATEGLTASPIPQRPDQLPFASVVIATRNRAASLAVCLDSILKQDYPAFDVIVVDNAPLDQQTHDLIASRYAPTQKVRYVRENRPGLGRAHNAGMEHVSAPIAAFTDDDVIADPRWLTSLVLAFDAQGHTGCVTGLILPAELETRAQYWTERHGGFGKGFQRQLFDLGQNRPQSPLFPYTAGQFGSGANMAFRTAALKKIGGFDSALGAGTPARGGDDLAAFYAVITAGYQLAYEPGAIVWHHHRRGEDGMERQAFGYGMGLGAYLTKIICDKPANALQLALLLPAGLRHMIGGSAPKTVRLPEDYPTRFIWRERLGILNGIPGYLKSRRWARSLDTPPSASGLSPPLLGAREKSG